MTTPLARQSISGWARYPVVDTTVVRPERLRELNAALADGGSFIARGLGRSYGDAALNSAGVTARMERLDRCLDFDEQAGVLRCEAGVTLSDLLESFAPRGWLPPVLPGTRHITMGGAVACDIHGKDHHRRGSMARHVDSLRLLIASGELLHCSRTHNAEIFWATLGGMGLTGIIVEVSLRLRRGGAAALRVVHQRMPNLDAALAQLDTDDEQYEYSVAWIDGFARGASLGRSILMRANPDHARPASYEPRRPLASVPARMPNVLRLPVVRGFNELYYRTHRTSTFVETGLDRFFFPLDRIRNWNRLYGRRGFVQYQFMVPPEGTDTLARVLERIARSGSASFLAVLKRFGPGEPDQMLSFAEAGYTLAVDFPATDRVLRLLDDLDEKVARAGGRVYLAKDARMRADVFASMYPGLQRWLRVKHAIDPEHIFTSDLARRLRLA